MVNEDIKKLDQKQLELAAMQKSVNAVARNTFNKFLPMWVDWFFENLKYTKNGKTIRDIKLVTGDVKAAVVMGDGPSITEEQLKGLKNFKGTIIATNKAISKLLNVGVTPTWGCAIDSQEIVLESFKPEIVKKHAKKIKFYGMTSLHPKVVKFIVENFKEAYWGNATIPYRDEKLCGKSVCYVMNRMNNIQESVTGGNAGSLGYLLATQLKCNPIGLLGFDMSHKPNPKWNRQMVAVHKCMFNPDGTTEETCPHCKKILPKVKCPECNKLFEILGEFFAVSPAFESYLALLFNFIDKSKKEGTDTINLTRKGSLYSSPLVKNLSVKQFIDRFS